MCVFWEPQFPLFSQVYLMLQSYWTYTVLQICNPISYLCWDAPCSPCPPTLLLLSFQSDCKYLLQKSSLSFPSRIDRSFFSCHHCFITADLHVSLPSELRTIILYSPLMYPTPSAICKGKHPNFEFQTHLQPLKCI